MTTAAKVIAHDATTARLLGAAALTDCCTILDTTVERYNEIFDVNVRAPFFLIPGAANIMKREKIPGSIVTTNPC